MTQRKNEVLVEWLESSCKGERNRVNVKHILLDREDITVVQFLQPDLDHGSTRGRLKIS